VWDFSPHNRFPRHRATAVANLKAIAAPCLGLPAASILF
jgi:hypothetical protein